MTFLLSSGSLYFRLPGREVFLRQPRRIVTNHVCHQKTYTSRLSRSFLFHSRCSLRASPSPVGATVPSDDGVVTEGVVHTINYEDVAEKDWSFLDSDDFASAEGKVNVDRIISAGEIQETSRVMVSVGSEAFVDQLVESSLCSMLLVVHDSLFVLAGIKEKYDKVKCWQGELIYVPDKWAPLDVVFLYFLPVVPFNLGQVFGAVAKCFSPGGRLVISHPQGREVFEKQREQYPDVITSDLPVERTLKEVAAEHCFELTDYVDEQGLYLAVLNFVGAS